MLQPQKGQRISCFNESAHGSRRNLGTLTNIMWPFLQFHTNIAPSPREVRRTSTATTSRCSLIRTMSPVIFFPSPLPTQNAVRSTIARECGRPSESCKRWIWKAVLNQGLDYLMQQCRNRRDLPFMKSLRYNQDIQSRIHVQVRAILG